GPVMAATMIWFGSGLRVFRKAISSATWVKRPVDLSLDTQPCRFIAIPRGGGDITPLMLQRCPNSLQRNDQNGPSGSDISVCVGSMRVLSSGTEQSSSLVIKMTAR